MRLSKLEECNRAFADRWQENVRHAEHACQKHLEDLLIALNHVRRLRDDCEAVFSEVQQLNLRQSDEQALKKLVADMKRKKKKKKEEQKEETKQEPVEVKGAKAKIRAIKKALWAAVAPSWCFTANELWILRHAKEQGSIHNARAVRAQLQITAEELQSILKDLHALSLAVEALISKIADSTLMKTSIRCIPPRIEFTAQAYKEVSEYQQGLKTPSPVNVQDAEKIKQELESLSVMIRVMENPRLNDARVLLLRVKVKSTLAHARSSFNGIATVCRALQATMNKQLEKMRKIMIKKINKA
ncbi:hypothetical protein J4464_07215 [Candidatus Woesearchaeota archaeon]|nr:hypothetical protein [Candidatus Woesearchaeota archaeon]